MNTILQVNNVFSGEMKKIVIGAVLITFVAFTACNKSKEVISPASKDVVPLPTAVVKFQTHDEFFNFLGKIDKVKEGELNAWEKSMNFISYRTVLRQARVEWDSLKTDADEAAFLKKYSDILEMKDNAIDPLIKSRFYQAICNRDGIFATSHGLTRIHRDYSLNDSTGNYAKLMRMTEQSHAAVSVRCSSKFLEEELASVQYDNWQGCWGPSRRIRFYATKYMYIFWGSPVRSMHRLEFHAEALKTKWTCRWKRYATEIRFRNIQARYLFTEEGSDYSSRKKYHKSFRDACLYTSSEDQEEQEESWYTINLSNMLNQLTFVTTDIHASAEATTRGLDGHWVSISF